MAVQPTESLLTFIKELDKRKWNKRVGLYQCNCGNTVELAITEVDRGDYKSCGCLRKKINHGLSKDPTWKIWHGMMTRCYNTKHKKYADYGGRGITVCDRWKNNYANFLEDMGERPAGLTLERKDNAGNYEPENCKWATWQEQHNNKRNNRFIDYDGRRQTVAQWARELNVNRNVLGARIKRLGIDKAFNHEKKVPKPKKERVLPKREPLTGCSWLVSFIHNNRSYCFYCNKEPCGKHGDLCSEHYDKVIELGVTQYNGCNINLK